MARVGSNRVRRRRSQPALGTDLTVGCVGARAGRAHLKNRVMALRRNEPLSMSRPERWPPCGARRYLRGYWDWRAPRDLAVCRRIGSASSPRALGRSTGGSISAHRGFTRPVDPAPSIWRAAKASRGTSRPRGGGLRGDARHVFSKGAAGRAAALGGALR